jgi:outer membrane protein OmpA-like peptidoglycan-associated protein
LSQKFDQDSAGIRGDFERQLKELADKLEAEKKSHSNTREQYYELQKSF